MILSLKQALRRDDMVAVRHLIGRIKAGYWV